MGSQSPLSVKTKPSQDGLVVCERWDLGHSHLDLRVPSQALKNPDTRMGIGIFGCECSYRTFRKRTTYRHFFHFRTYSKSIYIRTGCVLILKDSPTPYKTVHRTVLYPRFARVGLSSPISSIKKSRYPDGYLDFLVREMGLEPTRHNHTHLKRACLPFQHSRKQLEYYNFQILICQYFSEKKPGNSFIARKNPIFFVDLSVPSAAPRKNQFPWHPAAAHGGPRSGEPPLHGSAAPPE